MDAGVTARLPAAARRRALAEGARGKAWLADLPKLYEALVRRWGLTSSVVLEGGSEALAVAVDLPDGRAAVLKIAPPWAGLMGTERRVLEAAAGRGFAELYAVDEPAGALLMERLGERLDESGLPVEAQWSELCRCLQQVWRIPPPGGLMDGAGKARSLLEFIGQTHQGLGGPLSPAVLSLAQTYAEARATAHLPDKAVLAHGDGHAANALASAQGGFKLIDPDPLFVEPAYDLGILMREWTQDMLSAPPLQNGRARCEALSAATGVDASAIWQWGFLETVSTGLLCVKLEIADGPEMLQIAEAWAEA